MRVLVIKVLVEDKEEMVFAVMELERKWGSR